MTDDGEDSTSQSMSPDSMDEERPLKKARYVWQIKGRYRWRHQRGQRCSQLSSSEMPPCVSRALVAAPNFDCPVLGWQTRQMARAVVDNTINQVLEDMGFFPKSDDEEEIISYDINPTAHNREGIENQAVLMAIQSHGLQKPCLCSHTPSNALAAQNIPFHHRPSTPLQANQMCAPSTSELQEGDAGETDFLAQAVAVAIQKKGLSSYSQADHG